MRALALEHWRSDAFAVFGEVLAERQIAVDRVLVSDVVSLPDWNAYDLMIAMGGPMGVYQESEYPWLVGEKRAIREAVQAGRPFFGVCFGAQLLASALGADVYRGHSPELGLNPVFLTEAARRDPLFRAFRVTSRFSSGTRTPLTCRREPSASPARRATATRRCALGESPMESSVTWRSRPRTSGDRSR